MKIETSTNFTIGTALMTFSFTASDSCLFALEIGETSCVRVDTVLLNIYVSTSLCNFLKCARREPIQ
jgi:hypothetical protein